MDMQLLQAQGTAEQNVERRQAKHRLAEVVAPQLDLGALQR